MTAAGRGEVCAPKPDRGFWIVQIHARGLDGAAADDVMVRIVDPVRRGHPPDPERLSQRLGLSLRHAQTIPLS